MIIEQTLQEQCKEVEETEHDEQCNTVTVQECSTVQEYKCTHQQLASPIDPIIADSYDLSKVCNKTGFFTTKHALFQARVQTAFDPSSKDQTTEQTPGSYHASVSPNKVRQLGVGSGPYENRWKRKKLVRTMLKDDTRSKRSPPPENNNLTWNSSIEVTEGRMKKNYKNNDPVQSQDRAAVWGIQQAFQG